MVIEGNYIPIIGARAAEQMNLIVVQKQHISQVTSKDVTRPPSNHVLTKEDILSEYCDIFSDSGLGKMEGKLHFEFDASALPVVMPQGESPLQ